MSSSFSKREKKMKHKRSMSGGMSENSDILLSSNIDKGSNEKNPSFVNSTDVYKEQVAKFRSGLNSLNSS